MSPWPCWRGQQRMGRNVFCGVRFWSWWTAAFCRRECPGWEESATIFLARLRVLEVCRSSRVGKLQPITFSAVRSTSSALLCFLGLEEWIMEVSQEFSELWTGYFWFDCGPILQPTWFTPVSFTPRVFSLWRLQQSRTCCKMLLYNLMYLVGNRDWSNKFSSLLKK